MYNEEFDRINGSYRYNRTSNLPQDEYRPAYTPPQSPPPQKKEQRGVKIAALLLACAVLGAACGFGGSALDRHLSRGNGRFMINGHKVPTIGNICMDMCMLDVTGLDVKVGDTVTIFGEDPTITDLAEILDTIPYEILTSVPRRIQRIIVK